MHANQTTSGLFRYCGVALATCMALAMTGCGGEEEPAPPAEETAAVDPSEVEPTPDLRPEPPEPIPVGEVHFQDTLQEISNQTAVVWVEELGEDEVVVGVTADVYRNDPTPVVKLGLRLEKTKEGPVTIYVVDASVADKGWTAGSAGLIETMKLPLKMDLRGGSQ